MSQEDRTLIIKVNFKFLGISELELINRLDKIFPREGLSYTLFEEELEDKIDDLKSTIDYFEDLTLKLEGKNADSTLLIDELEEENESLRFKIANYKYLFNQTEMLIKSFKEDEENE